MPVPPPSNIPVALPDLGGHEEQYVTDCIRTGWISAAGSYVSRFEREYAAFVGTPYAVTTMNATAALHLAVAALGLGPGDEVIVPALTFIASANAVRYTGATVVLADVCPDTWTLDPEDVARKLTRRTRAIMPVHLYGHPADMDAINDLARSRKAWVIEDAAEAHGALYKGAPVGGLGDVGVFSFFGNKIITTGEGGMLTTRDAALAERLRMLRDHGMRPGRKYWHDVVGFNYRMTNLQAAVGVAQLERASAMIEARRRVAARYSTLLSGIEGISLQPQAPWAASVCWMYCILVDAPVPGGRDGLMAALGAAGIDTRPFFHCLHAMPPYRGRRRFPVSEHLSQRGMNLPTSSVLATRDINRVARCIRKAATPA